MQSAVILQGGMSIKTIYCFNILTSSRCADHKQNFTVCFCTAAEIRSLRGCEWSVWSLTSPLTLRSVQEKKDSKSSKHAKSPTPALWDNISENIRPRSPDWAGSPNEHAAWCHCFHNLNHFLPSLFKHEIRLDEICIRQYHPMTGPSVNVIGELLAKLMFSRLLCRFALTASPWIFHRPYVTVHRGHGAGV